MTAKGTKKAAAAAGARKTAGPRSVRTPAPAASRSASKSGKKVKSQPRSAPAGPSAEAAKSKAKKAAKTPARAARRDTPALRKKAARPARRKSAPAEAAPPKPRRKSPSELRKFREQLVAKRQELLQAYLREKGDSRTRIEDGTEDYIDYAVNSYDREFLLSLTEMEQKHLLLVEEALKRLDRKVEFGLCAQCHQEIAGKRLEVQPWARYCLRCQELDEQGLLSAEDQDADDESWEDDDSVALDDSVEEDEIDSEEPEEDELDGDGQLTD